MREMTSPDGKPVSLNRADLDCLFAAASLVDPAADGALCALHLRGRRVFGGTTHRAAAGTLSCRRKLPALALEPARLLQLADHAEASTGCLGWDGESARLALDNGALIECPRLDCSPLNDAAWGLADWPLPHWAEASRAELLELVELIAAAAWGWGAEDDPAEKARAAFTISPNLIGATVFRSERVSFMLGGSIGAKTAPDVAVQFFLNRAYLRDCVAALPASEDRARLEFGEPLQALRFSCPGRPGLATVMMPMKAPEGVSFRVVSSS